MTAGGYRCFIIAESNNRSAGCRGQWTVSQRQVFDGILLSTHQRSSNQQRDCQRDNFSESRLHHPIDRDCERFRWFFPSHSPKWLENFIHSYKPADHIQNPKEIETILRFSSGRFAFPSNDSPINEWLQFYANLSNIIIGLALEIRCVFPWSQTAGRPPVADRWWNAAVWWTIRRKNNLHACV